MRQAPAPARIALPVGLPALRRTVAAAALAGVVATAAAIAVAAAAGRSFLVPASEHAMPGWLAGPLEGLGSTVSPSTFTLLLLAMCGCYVVALALANDVPMTWALGAIVAAHAAMFLSPVVHSTDVFGYLGWARLGALHGIDPYSAGPASATGDPVLTYFDWHTDLPSPYGPLFTIATYAAAPLGVAGGLWALKAVAALSSLGVVALTVRCADRLGRPPTFAALLVGLNPLVLVFAVGGAHNDTFMALLAMAGIYLILTAREPLGGAALVAAGAIKAPGALALPFAVAAAPSRRGLIAGALAGVAAVGVAGVAVFGGDVFGLLRTLGFQQDHVALYSVPSTIGRLLGLGGVTLGVRIVAMAALVLVFALMLRYAARSGDWITAAGWATLALLLATAWLLPWYVVWVLPLAALSKDRRLTAAALTLVAYVVTTRVLLWT